MKKPPVVSRGRMGTWYGQPLPAHARSSYEYENERHCPCLL
jgi:hypothetical protein